MLDYKPYFDRLERLHDPGGHNQKTHGHGGKQDLENAEGQIWIPAKREYVQGRVGDYYTVQPRQSKGFGEGDSP